MMKAVVDRDGCISCGLCAATCPEVFRMADDDLAEAYVDPVPSDAEESAVEAADGCPVSVITVE
jgi:ferredoxin